MLHCTHRRHVFASSAVGRCGQRQRESRLRKFVDRWGASTVAACMIASGIVACGVFYFALTNRRRIEAQCREHALRQQSLEARDTDGVLSNQNGSQPVDREIADGNAPSTFNSFLQRYRKMQIDAKKRRKQQQEGPVGATQHQGKDTFQNHPISEESEAELQTVIEECRSAFARDPLLPLSLIKLFLLDTELSALSGAPPNAASSHSFISMDHMQKCLQRNHSNRLRTEQKSGTAVTEAGDDDCTVARALHRYCAERNTPVFLPPQLEDAHYQHAKTFLDGLYTNVLEQKKLRGQNPGKNESTTPPPPDEHRLSSGEQVAKPASLSQLLLRRNEAHNTANDENMVISQRVKDEIFVAVTKEVETELMHHNAVGPQSDAGTALLSKDVTQDAIEQEISLRMIDRLERAAIEQQLAQEGPRMADAADSLKNKGVAPKEEVSYAAESLPKPLSFALSRVDVWRAAMVEAGNSNAIVRPHGVAESAVISPSTWNETEKQGAEAKRSIATAEGQQQQHRSKANMTTSVNERNEGPIPFLTHNYGRKDPRDDKQNPSVPSDIIPQCVLNYQHHCERLASYSVISHVVANLWTQSDSSLCTGAPSPSLTHDTPPMMKHGSVLLRLIWKAYFDYTEQKNVLEKYRCEHKQRKGQHQHTEDAHSNDHISNMVMSDETLDTSVLPTTGAALFSPYFHPILHDPRHPMRSLLSSLSTTALQKQYTRERSDYLHDIIPPFGVLRTALDLHDKACFAQRTADSGILKKIEPWGIPERFQLSITGVEGDLQSIADGHHVAYDVSRKLLRLLRRRSQPRVQRTNGELGVATSRSTYSDARWGDKEQSKDFVSAEEQVYRQFAFSNLRNFLVTTASSNSGDRHLRQGTNIRSNAAGGLCYGIGLGPSSMPVSSPPSSPMSHVAAQHQWDRKAEPCAEIQKIASVGWSPGGSSDFGSYHYNLWLYNLLQQHTQQHDPLDNQHTQSQKQQWWWNTNTTTAAEDRRRQLSGAQPNAGTVLPHRCNVWAQHGRALISSFVNHHYHLRAQQDYGSKNSIDAEQDTRYYRHYHDQVSPAMMTDESLAALYLMSALLPPPIASPTQKNLPDAGKSSAITTQGLTLSSNISQENAPLQFDWVKAVYSLVADGTTASEGIAISTDAPITSVTLSSPMRTHLLYDPVIMQSSNYAAPAATGVCGDRPVVYRRLNTTILASHAKGEMRKSQNEHSCNDCSFADVDDFCHNSQWLWPILDPVALRLTTEPLLRRKQELSQQKRPTDDGGLSSVSEEDPLVDSLRRGLECLLRIPHRT